MTWSGFAERASFVSTGSRGCAARDRGRDPPGVADVIYQAYLTDATWRGFADFLERLPDGTYPARYGPSTTGRTSSPR